MTSIGLTMLGDQRMALQVVPDFVKKMWNEQAIRGFILLSVSLQIMLSLLANLRKYKPRTVIRISLWCVYFLAYAVVPVALRITAQSAFGVCNTSHSISKNQQSNRHELMAFWAQFLLLHLGGPDTITAYSLEDNEIWLRHLVFLVLQSGVTLYILLLSLPGCSHLPLLSIFVYAAGCIKCFERVQALRLGSTENLRESMLGPADPGPDYAKFLEEFQLRKSLGFIVKVEEIPEPPLPVIHAYSESRRKEILDAYGLFRTFKRIFVDHLLLSYEDGDMSKSYFQHLDSARKAFHVVEIELGFAYDMLYTKAWVVFTDKGLIIRAASILLVVLSLVGFHFLDDMGNHLVIDVVITHILIAAELSKEILAVITMLRSDWTDLWLTQHDHTRDILIFPFLKQPRKQRWSNSIAQLDLISVALEEKPATLLSLKFFALDKYLEKQRYKTYSEVSANLKDMIYSQFCEFMACSSDPKALCMQKGSFCLQKNECTTLLWSINEVEFDQSILIWHIATSLCYYSEVNDQFEINRVESKHISEYLVNLLIANPEMLPIGIDMIRYRDTCAEAMRFFKMKGPITKKAEACRMLLEVKCNEFLPCIVKGDRSKSVLFDGCRLALVLREMDRKRMWKVMSQVWIEILAYAAAHCRGFHHSQQLGRGGEFLTHVWLLMAHLGMTQHFHVSQVHARSRLNVS